MKFRGVTKFHDCSGREVSCLQQFRFGTLIASLTYGEN
jgi:hypothetical protein